MSVWPPGWSADTVAFAEATDLNHQARLSWHLRRVGEELVRSTPAPRASNCAYCRTITNAPTCFTCGAPRQTT